MIAIRAASEEILNYLPAVGLARHSVSFNPTSLRDITTMIDVGTEYSRTLHGYAQREGAINYIECLAPETVRKEPINKMWIRNVLERAKLLDRGFSFPEIFHPHFVPNTITDVWYWFECAYTANLLSVDIETDQSTNEISAIAFAYRDSGGGINSMSIPFTRENFPYWSPADEADVWTLVAKIMAEERIAKIFHNFIFDTLYLSYFGVETRGTIYCTMTLSHWLNPEIPKSLEDLGRIWLFVAPWKHLKHAPNGPEFWEYNAKDAAYTLAAFQTMITEAKETNRHEFYFETLTPLAEQVLRTCERGWTLDTDALSALRTSLESSLRPLSAALCIYATPLIGNKIEYRIRRGKPKLGAKYYRGVGPSISTSRAPKFAEYTPLDPSTAELKKLASLPFSVFERIETGRDFNPASSLQLKAVLKALKIRVPFKQGRETTEENKLLPLIDKLYKRPVEQQFLKDILEFRGQSKLIETYCNATPDFDGQYRFSLTIPGTVEARFSSSQTPIKTGFNSQNIPRSFRHLVIPSRTGWVIGNLDLKQADPHVVAWLAGEETMASILSDPSGDLHAHTASGIYGYDIRARPGYDKDTSLERKVGKNCNNALNYGMQILKFIELCRKQGLHLSFADATRAYNAYFTLYPGIRSWQHETQQRIIRTRELVSPFGRRRYFYDRIDDRLFRAAYAWIPPTTVADALNQGWLRAVSLTAKQNVPIEFLQQCHDSLMFQCPATEIDAVGELLLQSFADTTFICGGKERSFPVDIGFGPNWRDTKKWKISSNNIASL